ncbi:unnamed protein product [Caenorhabditis sp. 36 PRJEB53466]|nr:unnamed protein product [Caenorhabditis sp. 36 PRJEB53466]
MYKKRYPCPDFSDVIDVPSCSRLEGNLVFVNDEVSTEIENSAEKLGLIHPSLWRVYCFKERPGLYILPGLLQRKCSAEWLARTIKYSRIPNTTNLALHGMDITSDDPLKEVPLLNKKLRWTTLGLEYDWNTKKYPLHGGKLPDELTELATLISLSLNLGQMRPDAAIINYYPPNSTLSPHVDRKVRTILCAIDFNVIGAAGSLPNRRYQLVRDTVTTLAS